MKEQKSAWTFRRFLLPLGFCLLLGLEIAGIIFIWQRMFRSEKLSDMALRDETPPLLVQETPTSAPSFVPDVPKTETVSPVAIAVQKQLPESVLIPVPFAPQAPEHNWDQPWQDACEEAVILMLHAFHRGYSVSPLFVKDEILKMVAEEDKRGWGLSIEIEKIAELYAWYDNTGQTGDDAVDILFDPTVDDLKRLLASGRPILAVVAGKELSNPHFRNGGPLYHTLIIRGYTPTTFITNDPGTRFGNGFAYTHEDLLSALHDWNDGDVGNGRAAVMVLAL